MKQFEQAIADIPEIQAWSKSAEACFNEILNWATTKASRRDGPETIADLQHGLVSLEDIAEVIFHNADVDL